MSAEIFRCYLRWLLTVVEVPSLVPDGGGSGRTGGGDARQLWQRCFPLVVASAAASERILLVSDDAKIALKGATAVDEPPPRGSTSLFHVRVVEDLTVFHKHASICFTS